MIVFLDGAWLRASEARIASGDQGLLHGDGVYETARLYRGHYFRLAEHLQRLHESAAMLHLPVAASDELRDIVYELAARNALQDAVLRITITRGAPPGPATTLITLQPIAEPIQERARRGWRVIIARTRRPPAHSVPPALKALGRTYALLARLEAVMAGADDAIMLSDGGHLAEGPSWNLFWRRGETLFTPHRDVGILGGITRAVILDMAAAHGHAVEQGAWPPAALADADEIFATMTSLGVVSLAAVGDRALPASRPTALWLHQAYWDLVQTEADRE